MLTVNCFLRILSYLTLYRVKSFYKLLVHFLTTQISGESVSYNTITPFLPLRQATLRQRIQQYQVFCDMLKNDKCLPLSVKMKYRHNIQRPCDRQGHFLALKRCEWSRVHILKHCSISNYIFPSLSHFSSFLLSSSMYVSCMEDNLFTIFKVF